MIVLKNKQLSRPFYVCAVMTFAIVFFSPALAQSTSLIQVGRYQTVNAQPLTAQTDLLSPIIQVHFLSDIKTVGDAINDILQYSGYALIESQQQGRDLQNTLEKPLPFVDRDLGPMSLRQALNVLIGSAFDLSVDPLHRTINFQLKPHFITVNSH